MKPLSYVPAYFIPPYSKPIISHPREQRTLQTYETTPGDTFQDLLTRYDLSPDMLLQLNPDLELAPKQIIHFT